MMQKLLNSVSIIKYWINTCDVTLLSMACVHISDTTTAKMLFL